MQDIEGDIATTDADFAAAANAYGPITNGSGERVVWEQLQTEHSAMEPDIAKVIALSRRNLDVEARALMRTIDRDRSRAFHRKARRRSQRRCGVRRFKTGGRHDLRYSLAPGSRRVSTASWSSREKHCTPTLES